jgi:malonyl-CoA O-methyltransferase
MNLAVVDEPFVIESAAVRRAFSRASGGYDDVAVLHTTVRGELLARLDFAKLSPSLILDVGAGTGHGSLALHQRFAGARVLALDSARGMLREARRRQRWRRRFDRICADAALLPLPDASVDLIFSNLMLQWCWPDEVLAELRRVLRPGGLLALSSCGPDTLRELRAAWAAADDAPHVLPFIDMHDLGDALSRAGFASPVLDVDRWVLNYADVRAALRDLKAGGACNPLSGRRRSLTGRRRFEAMTRAYEGLRAEGRIPLTCEIVFAHAWAGSAPARRSAAETGVPLAQVTAQLPGRRGPRPP